MLAMKTFCTSMVQLYCSTDMATAWENSGFVLSEWSQFHMVDNLSIMVHILLKCVMTSHGVDAILLQRYMNWFTYFRGLPFNEVMEPYRLIYMNSIFSEFTYRPMLLLLTMQQKLGLSNRSLNFLTTMLQSSNYTTRTLPFLNSEKIFIIPLDCCIAT